jgi:hypothetical protein
MWFWRPKGKGEDATVPEADPTRISAVSAHPGSPPPFPAPPPGTGGTGGTARPAGPAETAASPAAEPPALPPALPPPVPGIMRPTPGHLGPPIPGIAAPGGALRPTRLSREVHQLLATLGTTRGEVAATFEAAGVRAVPGDAQHTPVSLFLGAVIGADPNVKSVTVDERTVAVEMRAWWRSGVVVDLPPVVHDFMAAFDECCYPALLPPAHRQTNGQG